jgi:hypothetical protein
VPSRKLKDLDSHLSHARDCEVTSYAEAKINKLASSSSNASTFREINDRMLSRVYPSGARVDSSNYDPTVAWALGCQLVALNFQYHLRSPGRSSMAMVINDALFRNGANLGYVPRAAVSKRPAGSRLRVELVCGSDLGVHGAVFLRLGVGRDIRTTSASDLHTRTAFVKWEPFVHSFALDGGMPFLTVEVFRTRFGITGQVVKHVQKNPRSALLHSKKVASYAAPVSMLREGLRSLHLQDPKHSKATLLVKLTFE